LADHSLTPTSTKSNINILRYGIERQLDRNKSAYVSLGLYQGVSDTRTFSNKAASSIAPLVAAAPGNFLGVFPGWLRYTNQKLTRAISRPVSKLSFNYSKIIKKLNKIK
jgi:hypothetical protein